MDHFAGLDVSVKETSVCIVDDTGRIVREVRVESEPELGVLATPGYHFKRIGLEAGPLSQWLFSALAEAGLPVVCVETRHMRAVLKAQGRPLSVVAPIGDKFACSRFVRDVPLATDAPQKRKTANAAVSPKFDYVF